MTSYLQQAADGELAALRLTVDNVVPYLLSAGLLSERLVADGGLRVEGLLRRNRNLRVTLPDGRGYFLKQADSLAIGSRASVDAEARFYTSAPRTRPGLLGSIPRLVSHDAACGVLVLELLRDHRTLRELVRAEGQLRFPLRSWRAVGGLLGAVHQTAAGDPSPVTPFLLTCEPAPQSLALMQPTALAVFRIVQKSGLSDQLVETAELWEPTAFVHGDIRIDNVMIAGRADGEGEDVRLVDWEMSGLGDPMWDLAGALEAAVTSTWGRFGVDELCVAAIQSAARTLWGAHLEASGTEAGSVAKLARFAAARLVLTALETPNPDSTPTRRTIGYLQVAQNILNDPEVAATHLFALGATR